jgi:hypothetical protein
VARLPAAVRSCPDRPRNRGGAQLEAQVAVVKDAKSFLIAIKETTDAQFDDDAVDYLEALSTRVFDGLDAAGVKGRERDRFIFFDSLLKGVILKLRRTVLEAGTKLQDANLLDETKKLKKITEH